MVLVISSGNHVSDGPCHSCRVTWHNLFGANFSVLNRHEDWLEHICCVAAGARDD